jgi:hypothetical protein
MMKQAVKMVDIQVPESVCPHCFRLLDTVSNISDGSAPEPGDFTFCLICVNLLRFDQDLQLVASSFEELPLVERAKFAGVKLKLEETRREWNATHSKPWCG